MEPKVEEVFTSPNPGAEGQGRWRAVLLGEDDVRSRIFRHDRLSSWFFGGQVKGLAQVSPPPKLSDLGPRSPPTGRLEQERHVPRARPIDPPATSRVSSRRGR